jgi:hypothetical protein
MPRTDLADQTISIAGLAPAYEAANVDGNAFLNRGKTFLHVKNASAGAVTATLVTPVTVSGRAVADDAVSIPAGGERMIGPFNPSLYNNTGADANKVHVDYSAAASVTAAAVTLP